MNPQMGRGIIINATIVDPHQYVYKSGIPKDLLRLEISTTVTEIRRILRAYASHYRMLSQTMVAPITLVFGREEYKASLKIPPSRVNDLVFGKALKTAYLEPWIPGGPVTDKRGYDVKLAWALNKAGFPIPLWTHNATSAKLPKRKALPLLTVAFQVEGKRWHLLDPALTRYDGSQKPYK